MFSRLFAALAVLFLAVGPAFSQAGNQPIAGIPSPETLEILGLSVEGVTDEYARSFILQTSRLAVGQQVTLPGEPALGEAIRAIYRLGTYEDVRIVEERRVGRGIFLAIHVTETPRLRDYTFSGVKRSHRNDLQKLVPLVAAGSPSESAISRTTQIIKDFYAEKGHPLAEVELVRTVNEDNTVSLDFQIEPGPTVEVKDVAFHGNEQVSDRALRRAMETHRSAWWQFWKKAVLDPMEFERDKIRIIEKMNEEGFYDAEILSDSVYIANLEEGNPELRIEITLREGPRYHIREITWDGNTLYTDERLTQQLGVEEGQAYNSKQLQENLYGAGKDNDVYSLYMNSGYMRINIEPVISVTEGDSMDIKLDVFEGDTYAYGDITVAGNVKTKDHVILRELTTVPGQTFSRSEIQETIRRLIQLNYFTQESLGQGPEVNIQEEDKTVDLVYNLEETGTDQLELSGTWGQFGLILQLRFGFNNFSAQNLFRGEAWDPLPAGDGQQLSLAVQTNGKQYQQYSVSFTEPWFRGKPRPVGFSTSFSRIGEGLYSTGRGGKLLTFSQQFFFEQRLRWPDPWFSTSTRLGFQFFNNDEWSSALPFGISRQITIGQSLSRNRTDHPIFPSSGSKLLLAVEVAPPIGELIQYHKWRMTSSWNAPILSKISLGLAADFGMIGSLSGEDVEFERFIVGGSPFETQGFYNYFGKDIVYMRGYPIGALGPRSADNEPQGGRILNKYSAELRWMAIQSPQLQMAPYLFMDAGNAWENFESYNSAELFRSAGFGTRFFLPILGMVELAYGYNFDTFEPLTSKHSGRKKWTFQFSLGQGFGN